MRRRLIALPAAASALAALIGATASAEMVDVRAELSATRAAAVYFTPKDLPYFGYSYAVVVNNWTQPKELSPVYPTDTNGTLAEQTRSAFEQLDGVLKREGSHKHKILALNMRYVGRSFDDTMEVAEEMDKYLASRYLYGKTSGPLNIAGPPLRQMSGVASLEVPGALVEITPVILDPATATEERLMSALTSPVTPNNGRSFMIGAVTPQRGDFSVRGSTPTEKIEASLEHLDLVLAQIGATRKDVTELKVSYVVEAGMSEQAFTGAVEEYFVGRSDMPPIRFQPVQLSAMEELDVCVEAEGVMVL